MSDVVVAEIPKVMPSVMLGWYSKPLRMRQYGFYTT